MNFWEKFLVKWNEWIKDAQEYSFKHWKTIVMLCGLIAGGGLLAAVFGWPFALIVPLWLIFVAYVLKKKYKG